jgi:uncharacterized protein (DUF58 family)
MSALAKSLRLKFSAAMARWARQRQGPDLPPVTLLARRIYILPTRAGLGFGALILAILLTALNYSNSMAMLLATLLVGFMLVGIHDTHRHLKGLRINLADAADSFAGGSGSIELRFENTLATARGPLQLQYATMPVTTCLVPPRSVSRQYLDYSYERRGRHELDRIALWTRAPHGFFRAWCWIHLPLQAHVYPKPVNARPLPVAGGQRRLHGQLARAAGAEEWSALRPFSPGDSPRAVAWKQYARGAPLLVSQYEAEAGEQHMLDFEALTGLDTEARLSQLCAWVLQCEQQREPYVLRLPQQSLPRGLGAEQQRAALRALCLHGLPPGQSP